MSDRKIEEFKNQIAPLNQNFRTKTSLVTKISIAYLTLTLTNLVIFWVVSGANQMRLIGEKALLATDSLAFELLNRLDPLAANPAWIPDLLGNDAQKKEAAIRSLNEKLRAYKDSETLIVPEANLFTVDGRRILPEAVKSQASNPQDSETGKNILKALQLKELKNQRFYASPDTTDYKVRIYTPLVGAGNREVVLQSVIPMASMKNELMSLYRLAFALVAFLLLIQSLFGFWLFKILVQPIRSLANAAEKVAQADFDTQVPVGKRSDELGQLMFRFNLMSASLGEKTGKLESAIRELEKHHRTMQMELEMGKNIQQGIMPAAGISNRISFSAYYGPLEKVSGDYYDILPMQGGAVGIVITDASGHGVPAALVTIMAKMHFTALARKNLTPDQFFSQANEGLSRAIVTSDYLTAFYLVIHPDLTVEYCNAGHQKAIIWRKATGEIEELDTAGFFLGMFEDLPVPYETRRTQLAPHDRVILYTDGIIEGAHAENGEYGYNRFVSRIREWGDLPVADLKDKIMKDVDEWAGGEARRDDYTLFIVEIEGQAAGETENPETANRLYAARDFAGAGKIYRQMLSAGNNGFEVKQRLANCLFHEGRYSEAIPFLSERALQEPENERIHLKTGICFLKNNESAKAIRAFDKVLDIDRKSAAAWHYLAICHAKEKNYALAQECTDEALRLKPDDRTMLKLREKLAGSKTA